MAPLTTVRFPGTGLAGLVIWSRLKTSCRDNVRTPLVFQDACGTGATHHHAAIYVDALGWQAESCAARGEARQPGCPFRSPGSVLLLLMAGDPQVTRKLRDIASWIDSQGKESSGVAE